MDVSSLSIRLDQETNRKVINEQYRIIKKIGQGQYGKVLLGETTVTSTCQDKYVAIKTINRIDRKRLITKTYLSQATKIKREIEIMKECSHPNVVKLYQVIDDMKFDKILLILEYCKYGEIDWKHYNHYYEKYQKHYNDRKPLTINKILRDVINGLEYLHSYKKIIHRDLKPSNLLINSDNTIKISDFGVSLILENNANDAKELGKTMGTPAFFAPELCQFVNNRYSMITNANHSGNKVQIDHRIDIWSLGVTLYCLMFNNLPFNGSNEFEMFQSIVKEELKFPVLKHSSRTTEADIREVKLLKDLLRRLLEKDPQRRISIEQVKNHDFTTFDLDEIETRKFHNFNRAIFRDADKKGEKHVSDLNARAEQDSAFSTRIKRLFTSKTDTKPVSLPLRKSTEINNTPTNSNLTIDQTEDLEPLDDLLDSYLDDSSSADSLGSDVEQDVDTSDILGENNENGKLDSVKITSSSHDTLFSVKPKPLQLSDTSSFVPPRPFSTNSSPQDNSTWKPPRPFITPTNNHFTTIGASSPSSFKSIFSPSKRFFTSNKGKKEDTEAKNPTISSLSSPTAIRNGANTSKSTYTDLMEPPPIFAGHSTFTNSPKNDNIVPNSRVSVLPASGYGLSRITSSSSSLNLNAYLTDDSYTEKSSKVGKLRTFSSVSRDDKVEVDGDTNDIDGDDDDVGNDTVVIADDSGPNRKFKNMNDYLDSLN
ncbi:serine/threonine-protein kinase [Scheffersomyces stipitis CBS 6054]|uniref:Serine/threonine-protein kinase n=1 Tax=Scheffersomyces stipitis (strain ATCC 58785 / CBS 6054 / NBRC 10063 / NRRL Y-11545) TaxID=322104 RepID=A3LP42_PICST|nr:serine/threonine-protein kinase [Scheffersomyces stipitis CBS 6054]ABN64428.2 serine/threonine-protein kinase [Scheffersomyces stipitis CBS 6054]